MAGAVHVEGLREFQRACKHAQAETKKGLKKTLKEVGEPVRRDAESLAGSKISHITPRWSKMRTGLTASAVYIVPSARNRGGSPRPSLKGTLLGRAMIPSLEKNERETEQRFEQWLESIVDQF
jgi:hypothetical protein